MKFGVLQDYFDSVGIRCTTSWDEDIVAFNWWTESFKNYSGKELTRPEASKAATEKACEIRNEQLKD